MIWTPLAIRTALALVAGRPSWLDASGNSRPSVRSAPFYVIAAGLPNLPRVLTDTRSYAERLFNYRPIGQLSRGEAARALRDPAERLGVRFGDGALDVLLDAAGGYPYFIQEYGQAAWNLTSSTTIEADDATAAVQLGTEQLDAAFFRSRWERATPAERRLLAAMAQDGDGPSASSAVAQRMGIQITSLGPYRANLMAKGLIYAPEHGQIGFTVPGMARYVGRHHEDTGQSSAHGKDLEQ